MAGFSREDVVKGASFFDGVIDGKEIKTSVIFIEEPLDSSKGNAFGFRTIEYKCASVAMVLALKDEKFPFRAKVDFELSNSKRGQSVTVSKIVPLDKRGSSDHQEKKQQQ